jgi:HK97 family phage prohead protease
MPRSFRWTITERYPSPSSQIVVTPRTKCQVYLGVSGDRLIGDVKFADAGTYEFADQIFRLIKKGFITAGSVGFIPLDFTFSDDRRGGIDFHEQELLEFSIVPIPANANALVQAAAKD